MKEQDHEVRDQKEDLPYNFYESCSSVKRSKQIERMLLKERVMEFLVQRPLLQKQHSSLTNISSVFQIQVLHEPTYILQLKLILYHLDLENRILLECI